MKTFHFNFKKINAVFFMCFIFMVIITSCKEKPNDPVNEGNNEQARAEMLTHILPLDDAIEMYKTYGEQRIDLLKDSLKRRYYPNFNDTRTVWIDINTIKEYIKYVEERSNKAGITPTGLEFYFSVYPNETGGDQSNHQTFFIAPTEKNDKRQSGYTLVNGKKILLNTILKENADPSDSNTTQKAGFFSSAIIQDDGLLLNRGDDSPPGDNN